MKIDLLFLFVILLFFTITSHSAAQSRKINAVTITDTVHFSQVFNEERNYRIFLPPDYYDSSEKRYPVIYYFHGYGGRYNGPANGIQSQSAESRYYDEFNGAINYEKKKNTLFSCKDTKIQPVILSKKSLTVHEIINFFRYFLYTSTISIAVFN